ncbi:MAG: Transcriptional regulator, AraC family [Leuconostoc sp. DORA_2]|nr:MAG: Transcriptional regulator, AraC family [Leuconostoc sp. DORA_2]
MERDSNSITGYIRGNAETIEVFSPIELKFNNSKLKVELDNLALKY